MAKMKACCTGCAVVVLLFAVGLGVLKVLLSQPKGPPLENAEMTKPYHPMSSYTQTPWFYEEQKQESLKGKVALVTGGSTGIGKAIARYLYKWGAHVIVTSRKLDRAQIAVDDLQKEPTEIKGTLQPMALDLSDLDDVHKFAKDFQSKYTHLHYFVENAGLVTAGWTKGPWVGTQGYEITHVSNYLGHFLLLNLLLPQIQKSAPARIVLESSIAHWFHNHTDLNTLLPENQFLSVEKQGALGRLVTYGNTKLSQILMAFELQRRFKEQNIKGVTITPVTPAWVQSAVGSEDRKGYDEPAIPGQIIPDEGAMTCLHALFSPRLEEKTGIFLQPYWSPPHLSPSYAEGWDVLMFEILGQKRTWGCHEWIPHPHAHHREFQKKLWDASAKACGIETL
eukprot:gnl/MRDRNA2_/MRDRNA2_143818_c0_seq1.p1 gnl/MRDRNA2_/MRDRNA2_143818_c0~~gnl/MRDRNA2_/MRDRNA2_143818_c0_seq1.p1  ORF type:complete len:394 (-),score=61.66 gnl/MRDRNA2_/MRDRNA2_143818_c0_seq1:237-1418(-)